MGGWVVELEVEEVPGADVDRAAAYMKPWEHLSAMFWRLGIEATPEVKSYLGTVGNVYEQEDQHGGPPHEGDAFAYVFPDYAGMCGLEAELAMHWFGFARLVFRTHELTFHGVRFSGPPPQRSTSERFVQLRGGEWSYESDDDTLRGTGPDGPVVLPLRDLTEDERDRVQSWRAEDRCGCRVCEALEPTEAARESLLATRYYAQHEARFPLLAHYDPEFVATWLSTRDRKHGFEGKLLTAVQRGLDRSEALVEVLIGLDSHAHDHVRAAALLAHATRGFEDTDARAQRLTDAVSFGPLSAYAALRVVEADGLQPEHHSRFLDAVGARLKKRLLERLRYHLVNQACSVAVDTLKLAVVPPALHAAVEAWHSKQDWTPDEVRRLVALPTGEPEVRTSPPKPVAKKARKKPRAPRTPREAPKPEQDDVPAMLTEAEAAARTKKLGKGLELAVEKSGTRWQWMSPSELPDRPALALQLEWNKPTKTLLKSLPAFSALHEVNMLNNGALPDDTLRWLAALPSLRSLFVRADRFTDEGLAHAGSMTSLRTLCMSGGPRSSVDSLALTEAGYAPIAALAELERLDAWCMNLPDGALVRITDALTGLHTLRLDLCPLTDASIRGIANLVRLERLSLLRVKTPIPAAFEAMASLPMLRIVGLRGNSWITKDHLAQLAQTDAPIQELDLSSTDLSLTDLDPLIDLPSLRTLDVYGLHLDADELRERFPQLTEVRA